MWIKQTVSELLTEIIRKSSLRKQQSDEENCLKLQVKQHKAKNISNLTLRRLKKAE